MTFTATATDADSSDELTYAWEIDTANPPDSGNDDYATFESGPTLQGVASTTTHVFQRADRGAWYVRCKASDGVNESTFCDVVAFRVLEAIQLIPPTSPTISTIPCKNGVYVYVEGSSPLVVGTATNDATDPKYSESPREIAIPIKDGNQAKCETVAAAHLDLLKVKRYKLTNMPALLRDGLGILRGTKVRVTLPSVGIQGNYALRTITHDFISDRTTVSVGDYDFPLDDTAALVKVAKDAAQLRKDIGT